MDILSLILIVLGLALFETVSGVDNAIINAQVLSTMGQKMRRFFLFWGLLIGVFLVRGVLPWLIVWIATPSLGPIGALTATFSSDPKVIQAVAASAPVLQVSGGTFLLFLFFHWLFVEEKHYGLKGERFFHRQQIWFYAIASLILTILVWYALQFNSAMVLGVVIGSNAFFITNGLKKNAEAGEEDLIRQTKSDLQKLLYLEMIDATFSVDSVLGAFAFTLSVPLILLGCGLGAVVVRQLTMTNISRIQKYVFLENGAMYSIFVLGVILVLDSFGVATPEWVSPVITFVIVGYFFVKSRHYLKVVGIDD